MTKNIHYLQKKQEEKLIQEQLQQHEEKHYRIQNREAPRIRDYETYTESKKMSPELIKETKGRDNGENSKEGYEVMLDRLYLGNKPQTAQILEVKKINKWKELAKALTVEEMEL